MDSTLDNGGDYLTTSNLCSSCYYRVHREIKPLLENKEDWEKELKFKINADTILETDFCIMLGIDLMDHIVLSCNKYVDEDSVQFSQRLEKIKSEI